jgi:hypothetical protein
MLRLEFLRSGSPECPLLRFSGEDLNACEQLKETFERLAEGRLDRVRISELPGIAAIDDCRLIASIGTRNRGVGQSGGSDSFEWVLTSAGWDNNAGLIEPFCNHSGLASFQWLDSPSDIPVLFSPGGQW